MESLVAGAAAGPAFDRFYKLFLDTALTTVFFSEDFKRLRSTLRRIKPIIDDAHRNNLILNRTQRETQFLTRLLREGEVLIWKCARVKWWNIFKRWYYSIKLRKFDASLLRAFQLELAALHYRDTTRILVKVNKLDKGMNKSTPDLAEVQLHKKPDLGSDIMLRRRKQLNLVVLPPATATWILMEFYQYSFITLFSWVAMAVVICLFLWDSIHRLLTKEALDLSVLEISEEKTMEAAQLLRQRAEDGIRLMFHVSAEREWFVFGGVVVAFFLTSLVATYLDFLTVCYIGLLGELNMPLIHAKFGNRIRVVGENLRIKWERFYVMIWNKQKKMNLVDGSCEPEKTPLRKKKEKKLQKAESKTAGKKKEIRKGKKVE